NKIALYGPSWILLTFIPYVFGMGNLIATLFAFKIFVVGFYLGLLFLLWRLSNKNIWSLAFFGLNPLVLLETLVSSHNDVVMMFFTLLAYYLLSKKKILVSLLSLIIAILIKYATIFLLPIYIYIVYVSLSNKKINWQPIWVLSACSMYVIFFLSPIREEIYSWYFIWILPFVALIGRMNFLAVLSLGFSFGLLFRFAPFIYTRNWGGETPLLKKIATFFPPLLSGIGYVFKKKI